MHCSDHLWSQLSVPSRCVLSVWRLSGVDSRPTRARALGFCPDTRASGEMWQAKQLNSCYKSHLQGLQCAHLGPCWVTSLWNCQSFFPQAGTGIQSKPLAKSAFNHGEPRRDEQTQHWWRILFPSSRQKSILWHIPSEVKCWELSFYDQIHSIP